MIEPVSIINEYYINTYYISIPKNSFQSSSEQLSSPAILLLARWLPCGLSKVLILLKKFPIPFASHDSAEAGCLAMLQYYSGTSTLRWKCAVKHFHNVREGGWTFLAHGLQVAKYEQDKYVMSCWSTIVRQYSLLSDKWYGKHVPNAKQLCLIWIPQKPPIALFAWFGGLTSS